MKTLVVPTDFSSVSVNAMNYAVDMAQAINAELVLFHIYQRIKIRCYIMFRADGSMKCFKCESESSVGTTNIVATDFNPL